MGKKRKAKTLDAWCWYCDREFEDDKVLLQHQKAKHYKCPYCPRRLNTAGGLTVHLNQVHKAEPTTIENALPGRESFSIEIYGMVGVPEADLAEWRARKRGTRGGGPGAGPGEQTGHKRPLMEKMVMSKEQLRLQLEAHKALMSGKAPPAGTMPALFSQPPPGFGVPPPGFNMSVPPPGFGGPPPAVAPMPASANGSTPFAHPPPVSGAYPGAVPATGTAGVPVPASSYAYPTPSFPSVNAHEEAVKAGAKSRMVYTDTFVSPEEKLASTSKYRYVDPEEVQQQQTNASATSTQPLPDFSRPPPGYGQTPASIPPGAQSYPAITSQSHGEPASSQPFANTAESLAATNASAASGDVAARREADMQHAESAAGNASPHQSSSGGARQGRARAADLF